MEWCWPLRRRRKFSNIKLMFSTVTTFSWRAQTHSVTLLTSVKSAIWTTSFGGIKWPKNLFARNEMSVGGVKIFYPRQWAEKTSETNMTFHTNIHGTSKYQATRVCLANFVLKLNLYTNMTVFIYTACAAGAELLFQFNTHFAGFVQYFMVLARNKQISCTKYDA